MKKYLILIWLFTLTVTFTVPAQNIRGTIFHDKNKNGIKDRGEKGISGIKISDGLNVTKSKKNGSFTLPGWEKIRFITLFTPSNYTCKRWYIPINETKNKKISFALESKPIAKEVSFVHISDTETAEYNTWINNLREYARINKPQFIIHTGDICYKRGMKFHSENINTQTMGLPFYYCIGNHDLVAGDYGEQFYEKHFGPGWYAFSEGNTLFIITPMMNGDYRPSYTKKDIGIWLNNVLKNYPKRQPKIIFNHDLLTNGEKFIINYDKNKTINLSDYNIKAWLYGHWHVNLVKKHGDSGITSYGTAVAAKGGIDHSPSCFRVVNIDNKGNTSSQLYWTYINEQINIISPTLKMNNFELGTPLTVSVNTYHSSAPVNKVQYCIWPYAKSPSMHNLNEKEDWRDMKQYSDWNWQGQWIPQDTGKYTITAEATLAGGNIIHKKENFKVEANSIQKLINNTNWTNLLGNAEHYGAYKNINVKHISPKWTTNIGGNIFMTSPIIYKDKVYSATIDDNNAKKCAVVALDANSGKQLWKYKTRNSVKNSIVAASGLVIATDNLGFVYALNANTGNLVWEKDLSFNRLPGFVSGMVTDGQVVYTGIGNTLCALNALTGDELWKNKEWNGGEGSVPSLTLAKNILISSAHWRALHAHNAKTGKLLWTRTDNGLRFRDGTASYADNAIWLAQNDNIYKIDINTGKTINKFCTGMNHSSNSAPLVLDNMIITGSTHPGVAAFDKKTKKQKWLFETESTLFHTPPYTCDKQHTIETSPLLLGSTLFIGAMDGNLYLLDYNSGNLLQKFSFGAPILGTPAASGNNIFVTDFAGNIHCFSF